MKNTVSPFNYTTKDAFLAAHCEAARAAAAEEGKVLWEKSEGQRKLAALHAEVGLPSTRALIDALSALLEDSPTAGKGGRRRRTTITDEIRAKVKALAAEGKKAPTIAKTLGLSSPSVYNIVKGA